MLKKLFLNFLSGIAIGAGVALVAFLVIKKIDPKEESSFIDGDIKNYSLSEADLVKTGRYLRLTGKVLGDNFTDVKDFQIQADVTLKETFIERCWGKGFENSDSQTWYYTIECDEITSDHFDLPFLNTVFIKNVRLHKR